MMSNYYNVAISTSGQNNAWYASVNDAQRSSTWLWCWGSNAGMCYELVNGYKAF